MSDRRIEGNAFMPPDSRIEYVKKLQKMLQHEGALRQQRTDHFMSTDFKMENPGDLFPKSWAQRMKVEVSAMNVPANNLKRRDDYKAQAKQLDRFLQSATPIFERKTEEGCMFRIYRVGSIEVRTIQEHKGKEEILVVFSIESTQRDGAAAKKQTPKDDARITKITIYVEMSSDLQEGPIASHQYFVVLETDAGDAIVSEKCKDGHATWQENPSDLQARISLAKTVCCEKWNEMSPSSVKDLKLYQQEAASNGDISSKHYAQGAYAKATHTEVEQVDSFKPLL